jgi:hypothetical protein
MRIAALLALLTLVGCQNDYSYRSVVDTRPDIHDVVECRFDETDEGWEQYTCVPVFSAADEAAGDWERGGIGDFDIVQRSVFGAPFYQLFYTGNSEGGEGASDIGYALSMDGVSWDRHPYNPVLRRGTVEGSFDFQNTSVGCAAFDGDLGSFHLWYTGTNSERGGTRFGHATSTDGVHWEKDPFNPLSPLDDATTLPIRRVWGCDALSEDGGFHFWIGGVTNDSAGGIPNNSRAAYDTGYLWTRSGVDFDVFDDLVLEHREIDGDQFDAEGVHKPSVFKYDDPEDPDADRFWMVYAGYEDVIAQTNGNLISYSTRGRSLGMASSNSPDQGWARLFDTDPVPLDFSGEGESDNPRAFFINGRLHVFFTDQFTTDLGDTVSGIGLGISPFPTGATQ